jgi:hypothetical protein
MEGVSQKKKMVATGAEEVQMRENLGQLKRSLG